MSNPSNTQIAITLTAAQVLALGTTAVTIETLTSNSGLAYLPIKATFYKPAGTAYVAASPARLEVYDEDGNVWFSIPAAGFLDQATAQGRVLTANLKSVNAGNSTVAIRSNGALTVGDVGITVKIELEIVPIL